MAQPDSFQQNDPSMPSGGGPQFGLEEEEGWISKYGGSIILPIIALLILAGGIYLYASQQSEETGPLTENEEELPVIVSDELVEKEPFAELLEEAEEPVVFLEEEDDQIVIEKIVPEPQHEGGRIIEAAAAGEGVTHLARRALKHYLENDPHDMTNEHKVYIEDYLKDNTSSQALEVGEEVAFSEDLIREAIDASLRLTPNQLKNLEQYSALVAW